MLCVHSLDNEDILNNGHNFTICVYGTTHFQKKRNTFIFGLYP